MEATDRISKNGLSPGVLETLGAFEGRGKRVQIRPETQPKCLTNIRHALPIPAHHDLIVGQA